MACSLSPLPLKVQKDILGNKPLHDYSYSWVTDYISPPVWCIYIYIYILLLFFLLGYKYKENNGYSLLVSKSSLPPLPLPTPVSWTWQKFNKYCWISIKFNKYWGISLKCVRSHVTIMAYWNSPTVWFSPFCHQHDWTKLVCLHFLPG